MTDQPCLIEVAFPLKQASLDSVHEKNVRHGHISTLHIWPARRPLAVCRAALIATLLPIRPGGEKRAIEVKGRAAVGEVEVSAEEWAKACNLRGVFGGFKIPLETYSPKPRGVWLFPRYRLCYCQLNDRGAYKRTSGALR